MMDVNFSDIYITIRFVLISMVRSKLFFQHKSDRHPLTYDGDTVFEKGQAFKSGVAKSNAPNRLFK